MPEGEKGPKQPEVPIKGASNPIKPLSNAAIAAAAIGLGRPTDLSEEKFPTTKVDLSEEILPRKPNLPTAKEEAIRANERSKEIAEQEVADALIEHLDYKRQVRDDEQAKREADIAERQKNKNQTKIPESDFINPTQDPATVLRDDTRRVNEARSEAEGLEAKRRAQEKLIKK